MAPATTILRLEQGLRRWEESMWAWGVNEKGRVASQGNHGQPVGGPILHYSELRQHLLSLRTIEDFDTSRFCFPQGQGLRNLAATFPTLLASWCTQSRRVYHLDKDLQTLLMATSLDGVTWADVEPPFESFCISLEKEVREGDKPAFDLLLVAPTNLEDDLRSVGMSKSTFPVVKLPWYVMSFNADLADWKPVSYRNHLDSQVRRGLAAQAAGYLWKKKFFDKGTWVSGTVTARPPAQQVTKVLSFLEKEAGGRPARQSLAWRIVIGLCLYRKMFRPDSRHFSPWTKVPQLRQRGSLDTSITNGSEICSVFSRTRLSDADRDLLFRYVTGHLSGIELQCHFREGHWRRPPGRGDDPVAIKTVQVDPTIVRPDRWPEAGLPRGSKVTL